MSRQDLIRAYYTDVNGGAFPSFREYCYPEPNLDELAIDDVGNVVRWDSGEGWILIDELPGHRIENGKIMWSPGLWPPMEVEG